MFWMMAGALFFGLFIWAFTTFIAWLYRRRHQGQDFSALSFNQQVQLSLGPNVVALGGGTGLSSLLSGLKVFTNNLVAVVTVTDEGGSSGRLIRDWGVLPPGDIRNCLVALSESDDRLKDFMDFRFDKGDLQGHSLGNLMLLAATELTGDFKQAVMLMNSLLAIRGTVYPLTVEPVTLVAHLSTGEKVRGELAVADQGRQIIELALEPQGVKALRESLSAIDKADIICLGPGSLFTSVLPNLLVDEIRAAVLDSPAPIVYVANLMSQPHETEGMSLMDHLSWIRRVLTRWPDWVIVNDGVIPPELLKSYAEQGAVPLTLEPDQEAKLLAEGCQICKASLCDVSRHQVRHDRRRLAETILQIWRTRRETH